MTNRVTADELRAFLGFRPMLDVTRRRVRGANVVAVKWVPLGGNIDDLLSYWRTEYAAKFQEQRPLQRFRAMEAELWCESAPAGRYRTLYVATRRAYLFRLFGYRESHYATQHGFDGVPVAITRRWAEPDLRGLPVIECWKGDELVVTISLLWWLDHYSSGWLGVHNRPMREVVEVWAGLAEAGVPMDAPLYGGRAVGSESLNIVWPCWMYAPIAARRFAEIGISAPRAGKRSARNRLQLMLRRNTTKRRQRMFPGVMPERWAKVFPRPKDVGQSEYTAMYDCIANALAGTPEDEQAMLIFSMLAEFATWALSLMDSLVSAELLKRKEEEQNARGSPPPG